MGQENRILASRRLYFDIVFKNLVNKAVGPGGWSVIKWIKEIFKRVLSPARDGYATVLNYWEALTGVRGQAFSLTISRLLPKFFWKELEKGIIIVLFLWLSEIIIIFAAIIIIIQRIMQSLSIQENVQLTLPNADLSFLRTISKRWAGLLNYSVRVVSIKVWRIFEKVISFMLKIRKTY